MKSQKTMESDGTGEEKMKNNSTENDDFLVADERIKLIDISTENDDFLFASPFCDSPRGSFSGFRLSGIGNSSELEISQQKDQNRLPSDFLKQQRPSFYRRSLAWDNAFFDSPGVLDHDELSCINRGFTRNESRLLKNTPDVRKRRPEPPESRPNADGFCADWFEIEPLKYKHKSSKMSNVANRGPETRLKRDGLQNLQCLRMSDKASGNKPTATRKQEIVPSPKPPKSKISTRSTEINSSEKSTVKMKNVSTITSSGQFLFTKKKCSSESCSRFDINSGSLSSPKFSTLKYMKRKTESRKSRLSASLSAFKIQRHTERNKEVGNYISLSTDALSSHSILSSVDKNKQGSDGPNSNLDINKINQGPLFVHSDETEASYFHSPLNSPKPCYNLRPSELRPPSPQIGFFDENTSPRYHHHHDITRNRKMPQKKVVPEGNSCSSDSSRSASAYKKLRSPYSQVTKDIKRPKTDRTKSSSLDQENDEKKTLISLPDIEHGNNLSRYFAAIDLNQEKITQLKKRAPLADRTSSVCNSRRTTYGSQVQFGSKT